MTDVFGAFGIENVHVRSKFYIIPDSNCVVFPLGVPIEPGEGFLSEYKNASQHLLSLGLVDMKGHRDR